MGGTQMVRRRASVGIAMQMPLMTGLRIRVWTTDRTAVRAADMRGAWTTGLPSIRRWHRATARRCNAGATGLALNWRGHRATARRCNHRHAMQCLVHIQRRSGRGISRCTVSRIRRCSTVTLVFVGGRHVRILQKKPWPGCNVAVGRLISSTIAQRSSVAARRRRLASTGRCCLVPV